jgi:hypothetical protein
VIIKDMYIVRNLAQQNLLASHLNETNRGVRQLQRIVEDRLQRGELDNVGTVIQRVYKAIQQPDIHFSEEAALRLVTAQLLELVDQPQRAEGMLVKIIMATGKGFLQIAAETDRFRARLRLNCGDIRGAYEIASTIDRRLIERSGTLGELSELLVEDDEDKVTAPTWILLAEIAFTNREIEKTKLYLNKARKRAEIDKIGSDEEMLCRLLNALTRIQQHDPLGLAFFTHLYLEAIEDEEKESNRLSAPIRSCILAAAQDDGPFKGISKAEAERWRRLGPEREVLNSSLQHIFNDQESEDLRDFRLKESSE